MRTRDMAWLLHCSRPCTTKVVALGIGQAKLRPRAAPPASQPVTHPFPEHIVPVGHAHRIDSTLWCALPSHRCLPTTARCVSFPASLPCVLKSSVAFVQPWKCLPAEPSAPHTNSADEHVSGKHRTTATCSAPCMVRMARCTHAPGLEDEGLCFTQRSRCMCACVVRVMTCNCLSSCGRCVLGCDCQEQALQPRVMQDLNRHAYKVHKRTGHGQVTCRAG